MKTYEAIIDGDKVTWIGAGPSSPGPRRFSLSEAANDRVPPNGAAAAQIIRRYVEETGGLKSIDDPVAWQRELREDRPLPGREP